MSSAQRPIGIFDSGVGGLAALRALRALLPHERYVYVADLAYLPYGDLSAAQIRARTEAVIGHLRERGVKAIVALTESGSTALWMSRHRTQVPIFGLTTQGGSMRRMALYRNVRPLLMPAFDNRDVALAEAERILVQQGVLRPGDTYAITCGEPMGYPGGTNMLKVCRVG